jgi:hypothetical protein
MAIKPKILFVYESNHPIVVKDGLWAALDVLESTFDIKRHNLANGGFSSDNIDFVLGWGAFGSKVDSCLQIVPCKKGLCIAGNVNPPTGALNYDVLFYETKWYRPQIDFHPNIVHAFGYNSDIYYNMEILRDIDYLGVGAYAKWKRWEKFLDKKGDRRIVGEFQQNNPDESQDIWDKLENNGVICKDMVIPEQLNVEYNRAKTVYIPADICGGGERAILEARSCGCNVEVEPDNLKLKELLTCPLPTHLDYANKLRRAICELL